MLNNIIYKFSIRATELSIRSGADKDSRIQSAGGRTRIQSAGGRTEDSIRRGADRGFNPPGGGQGIQMIQRIYNF